VKFKTVAILFIIRLMCNELGLLYAQTNDCSNSLNSYSFDLYRETKVDAENLLLSPLSTYYALLVAYEGSKNKTRQEFERVLHLSNQGLSSNDIIRNLVCDSSSFCSISNAIWVDNSVTLNDVYRNSIVHRYLTDFEQTDFENADLAVSNMNAWVSEKTNRRIVEIVNSANIPSDTRMLISNAVFFKGEWCNKFQKQKTIAGPFFSSAKNQYKVDFMNMTETLQYFENELYQYISKPYKDSKFSFCIILPKNLFGIEDLEKKLNADFFSELTGSAYSAKTSLYIPKFKLESSFELENALTNLGLKTAFIDDADFSGITHEVPLMLGQVLHKTWIELDEEQTEAAAASVIGVRITGLPSYKVFKADHPFVFFVMDNETGAIVFMGRYVNPTHGGKIENENLTKNLENRMQEKFSVGIESREPLFVVDKKILTRSEFEAINPEDIESISVIKDAEEISKHAAGNFSGAIIVILKK
jgi:serpin B